MTGRNGIKKVWQIRYRGVGVLLHKTVKISEPRAARSEQLVVFAFPHDVLTKLKLCALCEPCVEKKGLLFRRFADSPAPPFHGTAQAYELLFLSM
jgi:hypothetical protein